MKKPSANLGQRLTAQLYKGVLFGLRCSHVKLVALLGRGIGHLAWIFAGSRRQIVARNLRIVIAPNLRPKELRPLVRQNMVLTCMNFACALKVGLMTPEEMAQSIRLEGKEIFENSGSEGRTGLACIPHAGNWEILARIRPLFTKVEHFGSMYRRMGNPALEEIVYNSRTRFGCEMFSKEAGIRGVLKLAKTGGLLGVLSDQYTQEGLFVPYFGKVTGTTPLPSILRRLSKGQLFSVYTRNRGLGEWDAVLGRTIETVPNKINQAAADTICINQALERCQRENILDGFWMHHRWKVTRCFSPKQDEGVAEVAAAHTRLPFRIIIALPECFEEALCCLPTIRGMKASRFDAQITLICRSEQAPFWRQTDDGISHVLSSDGEQSLRDQLEADAIYKDGPFDLLLMLSEDKSILKAVKSQGPIRISGLKDKRLSKFFKDKTSEAHCSTVRHRYKDYLSILQSTHELDLDLPPLIAPLAGGNHKLERRYIAPFSTLGTADSWSQENWCQLIALRPDSQLLALEEHRREAEQLAQELNIPCTICQIDSLAKEVGSKCQLIAVDGSLAQLAALYGAQTCTLMASRLPDRYAPWQPTSRAINQHRSCHPCYEACCQAGENCLQQVSVAQAIACLEGMAEES